MNNKELLLYKFARFTIVLFLCTSFGALQAQEHRVEVFPNRYRISWENVSMKAEPDLGFMGLGFDLFNLIDKSSTIYMGLNSYSAMTGERPGLITFGLTSGWRKQLIKDHLYIDIGGFVGGGGGANAADGGGLILRPHLVVEKQFGNLSLQFGFSRIDFPSGEITSNHVNFGITINGANFFMGEEDDISNLVEEVKGRRLRVAVVGTQYFNFYKGTNSEDNETVELAGVQIEHAFNSNLYGILKLNGAFNGGVDGYMSILMGGGGVLALIPAKLNLEVRLLAGPSGGGAIESGGGATTQAEVGASLLFKNGYDIKIMLGKTWAPWGEFNTNHLEIGIGKSLNKLFLSKTNKEVKKFIVSSQDYRVNHMAFSVYNRIYFPPEEFGKNGELYQSFFNLIGFEFQKFIGKRFSINGGTVWAYQGNYGAYAEGLLGVTYYQPMSSTWNMSFKGMFGAGGGGGIDLGSGLLFQYFVGIEKKLNQKIYLYMNVGKVYPLNGNFSPNTIDIGFKLHINQLLKKEVAVSGL